MKTFLSISGLFWLMFSCGVMAMSPDVVRLQQEWAEIKYRHPKEVQEQHFSVLLRSAEDAVAKAPDDAELWVWYGIIEGSTAGARGGLGALGLVKNAKKSFERAIAINAFVLEGSALTSLGSLYYQVPGWPIGFGDDKKALEFLRKGLAANPDGIDSNFFYGDFLYRSGDYPGAEQALRKALMASPRTGRAVADEGCKSEIQELLRKIADKRR